MVRRTERRRVRQRRAVACPWCEDPITSTSLMVVGDGCVWHAKCWDGQQGEGLCAECGYLLGVNRHPERTPSCRCHLASIVYGDET